MAASDLEIEITSLSDADQRKNANNAVTDVFSASVFGDLTKLRFFVEGEQVSLSNPDGNGYYALQWASLNNYTDLVQYIIEVYYP